MAPHSKTVRGTFDNPGTQSAIQSGKKPGQHTDPVSLSSEKTLSHDNTSAPTPSDPYRQNEKDRASQQQQKKKEDLPHSMKVRGTLAHDDGPRVNRTQLGDPASLTSETSKTEYGRDIEAVGYEKEKEGVRYGGEGKGKSKL